MSLFLKIVIVVTGLNILFIAILARAHYFREKRGFDKMDRKKREEINVIEDDF